MGVEPEVHLVLADAGSDGGLQGRPRIRAQARVGEQHRHHVLAADLAGAQDLAQEVRILGMDAAAGLERQHALRDRLHHRVDVGGLLAHELGAVLDLLDHRVERHHRLADLVRTRDGHAQREVLAGGDLGHLAFHLADGAHDLPIKHEADETQAQHRAHRHHRQRHLRAAHVAVERRDRRVLAAVLLDLQRMQDLALLAQVLLDAGRHVGLGQRLVPREHELGGVVDRVEIVLEALLRFLDQPDLRRAVGRLQLGGQRRLQFGLARDQRGARLFDRHGVGRADHVERGDLHVLELGQQRGRLHRAGHDAFGHGLHLGGALPRLRHRESTHHRERGEDECDEQHDALSYGHDGVPPETVASPDRRAVLRRTRR